MRTNITLHRILALCLVLGALAFANPAPAEEPGGRLLLKVAVVDKDLNVKPVPQFAFLVTRADQPKAESTRIVTRFDGTATVSLPAGKYNLRSEEPLTFEGETFEWSIELALAEGEEKVLELSNKNATVPEPELRPDSGSISGNVYTNDYFGFSYEFPEGWTPASPESQRVVQERGVALLGDASPRVKALIEAGVERVYSLLHVSQYPIGKPVEFNSNILLVAEVISAAT